MKSLSILVIFVALTTLFHQSSSSETDIRDEILKAYDKAKERLGPLESRILEDIILGNIISAIKNGSECFGNPPLDPLNYQENIHLENVDLLNYVLVDFLNVDGVRSTKLSEFLVHTFIFDLTGLAVVLNVTFPEINLDLDHYDLSAVALTIIPVDGNGTLQLTLQDVNVDLAFTLGSQNGSIFLDSLSLHLAVGEVKLTVTGLFGGSRTSYLAGAIVSSLAPAAIEDIQASNGPEIVEELKALINGLLVGDGESSTNIISCLIM